MAMFVRLKFMGLIGLAMMASMAFCSDLSRERPMKPNGAWPSIISQSAIIFSFSVIDITPLFDIDDMPAGSHPWRMKGRIQKVYKGAIAAAPEAEFESRILIYQGPVRKKPAGLWMNVIPQKNETWVVFYGPPAKDLQPGAIIGETGDRCLAVSRLEAVERHLMR